MVNWERLYDQRDFNEPVTVLHETIFKRLWINYVLNKYIPVNDSDTVLMNEIIKLKIKLKSDYINNMFRMIDLKVISFFRKLCIMKILIKNKIFRFCKQKHITSF